MKLQFSKVLMLALACVVLASCAATATNRSTGEFIDDKAIAASIKSALLASPDTDGLNIDVEVDRNKVQLNGFVDNQSQVDRAGEIARSTSGVASVENNLRVTAGDRTAGEYMDDNSLAGRVKVALANDPVVHSLQVDVEVNRGIVSLGGFVDTSAQRSAAVAAARQVDGVAKVVDNLTVR
jgi:hyperosmotically inducible periplasmic protein